MAEEQKDRREIFRKVYLVRRFDGEVFRMMYFARHGQTGEGMVVYGSPMNTRDIYVLPEAVFFSKTDKEKYPDAEQEWFFEILM